ncbi:MAG: DUF4250 domain-containing protein [Clostridia bacterium]|nr:DUF4250 domain-containing protein [Clostridia bacterium]
MIKDPFLLLSVVNTALRNKYSSLEDYCLSEDEPMEEIERILNGVGYFYNKELNSFTQN